MKKILFTLVFVGSVVSAFAQKIDPGQFSIGLEGGVPLASARAVSTFLAGGSLKYSFDVADKTSLSVSGGYIYFPYRGDVKVAVSGYAMISSGESYIPLKVGAKYFINNMFYAEGQVGAAISTISGGGTAFAYAPGVGYQIDNHADIGVRFESWIQSNNTVNQVAIRLAYTF